MSKPARNRNDFWTDERIELLKKLHFEGMTGSQIASHIGHSRNAVIAKIHRLGIQRGGWATQAFATRKTAERRKKNKERAKGKGKKPMKPNPIAQLLSLPLLRDDEYDVATTTVVDRETHQCSWIIGDPADQRMCGAEVVRGLPWGTPYCAAHAGRAFRTWEATDRPFIVPTTAEAVRRKQLREAGELTEFVEPAKEVA